MSSATQPIKTSITNQQRLTKDLKYKLVRASLLAPFADLEGLYSWKGTQDISNFRCLSIRETKENYTTLNKKHFSKNISYILGRWHQHHWCFQNGSWTRMHTIFLRHFELKMQMINLPKIMEINFFYIVFTENENSHTNCHKMQHLTKLLEIGLWFHSV